MKNILPVFEGVIPKTKNYSWETFLERYTLTLFNSIERKILFYRVTDEDGFVIFKEIAPENIHKGAKFLLDMEFSILNEFKGDD